MKPTPAIPAADVSSPFDNALQLEDTACLVCGAAESRALFEASDWILDPSRRYCLVRCAACGHVYQRPRPTRAAMAQAYPDEYLRVLLPPAHRRSRLLRIDRHRGLTKRRHFVERWVPGGRLLDMGSGSGEFLSCLAGAGNWQTFGLDLSHAAACLRESAHRPPLVEAAADGVAPFRSGAFDAITFWDVVEHLHDPRAALAEARRLIRPDGVLFVTVPDGDSFQARLFGVAWAGYDAPRHLSVFTRATLSRLLAETGWTVVEFSTFTGAPRTFVLSLAWALKARLGSRHGTRAAALVDSPAARLFLALPLLLFAKCGGTSHLTVVARPAPQPITTKP